MRYHVLTLMLLASAAFAQDTKNGPVPKEIEQMPTRFTAPAPGCGYTGHPFCYGSPKDDNMGATNSQINTALVEDGFPPPPTDGTGDPPPIVIPPVTTPPDAPPPAAGTIPTSTWVTVGKEGDTIAGLKGMTFRYGSPASTYAIDVDTHKAGDVSPAAWTDAKTLTEDTALTVGADSFGGTDPIYGVYKVAQAEYLAVAPPVSVVIVPPVTITCTASLAADGKTITQSCQ